MIDTRTLLLLDGGSSAAVASGIVGPLHAHRHGATATKDLTWSFADATGIRRLVGQSWFCGFRDYHQFRSESEDVLGTLAEDGADFIRAFPVLGYDNVKLDGPDNPSDDDGYYAGRGVSPLHAIEYALDFARACKRHGLGLQTPFAHQWNSTEERLTFEHRFWGAMKSEGVLDVFKMRDFDSEYFQNATMKDSDEQIREYARIYHEVMVPLGPDRPMCACGSPENEGPNNVWRSLGRIQKPRDPQPNDQVQILQPEFCDYLDIHCSRDQTPGIDETIKRPFSLGYNEGNVGMYRVPQGHSEPRGPLGPDAYRGSDKPGRLVAGMSNCSLWGGAVTFFSGEAVRGRSRFNDERRPSNILTADGVRQVVKLLKLLPENVGESGHVPGGNIWWWDLPDGRIATTVSELWPTEPRDPLLPPVAIKRSLIIGPNWEAREVSRAPIRADIEGHGGALIIAERA